MNLTECPFHPLVWQAFVMNFMAGIYTRKWVCLTLVDHSHQEEATQAIERL